MTLLFQNQKDFCTQIQKYGCRFRCLQAIAETECQQQLNCQQISTIYNKLSKDTDIMNSHCLCGSQEHLIIYETFKILESSKKARQIGMMDGFVPKGWDGKWCSFDYIIYHWKTTTRDGHYTLADKNGREIFDPWNHKEEQLEKVQILRKLLYKVWE